jgi:hypothetical protein
MNEKELMESLNQWFDTADRYDKNFWNRNKIAKVIKNRLKEWKHWKNHGSARFRNY